MTKKLMNVNSHLISHSVPDNLSHIANITHIVPNAHSMQAVHSAHSAHSIPSQVHTLDSSVDQDEERGELDDFSSCHPVVRSYLKQPWGVISSVSQSEKIAMWEDTMDALGSEPSLQDLQHMVDLAPSKSHPLYSFAMGVLIEKRMTRDVRR